MGTLRPALGVYLKLPITDLSCLTGTPYIFSPASLFPPLQFRRVSDLQGAPGLPSKLF